MAPRVPIQEIIDTMKVLAADIGGTNARFADVTINGLSSVQVSEPVIFPTWTESVTSFDLLLEYYAQHSPPGSPAIEDYDALAIAIAGAVSNGRATLPNIAWDIDLAVSRPLKHTFLLNDFFAQAHGYLDTAVFEEMEMIRPGSGTGPGSIAIVGAGTGLGHAALKSVRGERIVISSESGHATFSFHGEEEKRIEAAMLARKGTGWLSGDDVVTGSGIALLHEALTSRRASPGEALGTEHGWTPTCEYYARFYARACRNYCLSVYPAEALVITGGIAAKNPHIIKSTAFMQEFNDARSYRHLLERIPIYLNFDQVLGIRGAAIHAWQQLVTT